MFLFSYYCQEINLKDMSLLHWQDNIVEDRLLYHRGKTADMFSIHIKRETVVRILEKQKQVLSAKLGTGLIKNTLIKKLSGSLAAFLGICLASCLPGLLIGIALGLVTDNIVDFFQVQIWFFCITFVLYLILGGKAEDMLFWRKKKH